MRRRAWHSLRLVVEVVHDIMGRDAWGEPDPVPETLDRQCPLIVAGICVGIAVLVAVAVLRDLLFALAAVAALYALRHLAATRLRVLAGWALTAWALYLLLWVALAIVGLVIQAGAAAL